MNIVLFKELSFNFLRGQWSHEEDLKLITAFVKFGKKWASISQELPKRSQHAIKNRFYHLMAKHLNVTNREVIKSRESYQSEAANLLSSLSFLPKTSMPEADLKRLIKTEEETAENRNLTGSLYPANFERPANMTNMGGSLPVPDYRLLGSSSLMTPMRLIPSKVASFPFNSLNLLYQNVNNNMRK